MAKGLERGMKRQIVRLAEEVQAPLFHWGDLDGGGVHIVLLHRLTSKLSW